MNFNEKLAGIVARTRSRVCVGLDPDPALMPLKVNLLDFNKAIIDATSPFVCAYKLNLAFYEALDDAGLDALKKTIKLIPEGVAVIGDGKRADIGNTSRAYARALFDNFNFDAVTVAPYLGFDSLQPFIEYRDRGVFILCRTSNPGAADFQSLECHFRGVSIPLFEIVARKAAEWNTYGNVGLVMGATYPDELKAIRQHHPDLPLLIPGVGAQGGELSLVVRYALAQPGQQAIINSSRQIIYASRGADFAEAAGRAAQQLRDEIDSHLTSGC